MVHVDFALPPEPRFFFMPKSWAYKCTQYGTSVQFKNMNLQYFGNTFRDNV